MFDRSPPPPAPCDRRAFIGLAAGVFGTILLAGCGGGGGGGDTVAVVPAGTGTAGAAATTIETPTLSAEAVSLNLALTLEYIAAQFYAYGATGAGLPAALVSGLGTQGNVSGGRRADLRDALVAQHVAEIAADKRASVALLREQLGASVAAQPAIDFSSGSASAFSVAAQAAGIVAAGASFDPFADDGRFLIGALMIENGIAASYRGALPSVAAAGPLQAMTDNLGGAIYHGGLIRTLLSAKAYDDATLALSTTAVLNYMAKLDGSNTGEQDLADAVGASANIVDGSGNAVPFTRSADQTLKLVYLSASGSGAGGFLPGGINGVRI